MSDHVLTLEPSAWDREVLSAKGPLLVDFWATWCPPCRRLAPTLERLAADESGRLTVAKLDVDGAPELSARYGVVSIPTLLVFLNGEVVDRAVGALPLADLRLLVEPHLTMKAAPESTP